MKAFVTGATGFVGSHLVDLLLERFEVSCLKEKHLHKWLEGKKVNLLMEIYIQMKLLEKALKKLIMFFMLQVSLKPK